MANEPLHVEFANRTQGTIELLLTNLESQSAWIAIAAFYKAVHIVEAVFANDLSVQHTSNHDDRDEALRKRPKYRHLYQNYGPLKRASVNARYLANNALFEAYLRPADVVGILLKHHLHQIEKSAKSMLKTNDLISILHAFPPADPER